MATSSTVTMGEGGESNDRLSTRCPNSLAGMGALRWLRWSQQPGGRQTRKGPLCKRLPYAFGSSSRRSRPRPSARGHLKRLPATRALSVTCLGRAVRRRCDEPRRRSKRKRNEEGARAASTGSPAASPPCTITYIHRGCVRADVCSRRGLGANEGLRTAPARLCAPRRRSRRNEPLRCTILCFSQVRTAFDGRFETAARGWSALADDPARSVARLFRWEAGGGRKGWTLCSLYCTSWTLLSLDRRVEISTRQAALSATS